MQFHQMPSYTLFKIYDLKFVFVEYVFLIAIFKYLFPHSYTLNLPVQLHIYETLFLDIFFKIETHARMIDETTF